MVLALLRRIAFGRRMAAGAMPRLPDGRELLIGASDSRALIGGSAWPLAAALCRHLLTERSSLRLSSGVPTLELGAGTGAVGLFAAALGARCVLTELQPPRAAALAVSYSGDGELELPAGFSRGLLELLERNVAANRGLYAEAPVVLELDWTDPSHVERARLSSGGAGFELLLASDVTYQCELHAPLARAIARTLHRAKGVALVAHERRRSDWAGKDIQLRSFVIAAEGAGLHAEVSELRVPQAGSYGSLIRLSHRREGGEREGG
ncbi:hypothetical protein AB1Y20_007800 [Prymnesium parvum]|uniref:Calmodulin-lysine N-methyltransferase n=1 Tax=Prymnesium parvum TaxID=97485 RepID=A0AB34IRY3_PRYPA